MLDANQIVKAGGIVGIDAALAADSRTGVVRARTYAHEALPGRTVVRLAPDDVAPAADVEMATLGFGEASESEALGRQRFRALGFPGWALVNDPPRARFALEVMRDFKKAARLSKSKPGHGRDAFAEIAKRLERSVPHFLPSFWEEAGRAFLGEEATSFAAQCFEKAREAEEAHGLKIDEDLRSSVYLEFALGGALAAKSLTGYGSDLEKAYGAAKAYPRFYELAVRRMLGGMPPWAGMAKDLRGLAKRAKLDPDEEEEKLLLDVLDGKGLARAPAEFWSTYRPALERLATKHAHVRTRIRWLFPATRTWNNPFSSAWLPYLESTGALRAVTEVGTDEAALEAAGSAAAWLARLISYAPREELTKRFIAQCADRLKAEGVPVACAGKNQWWGLEIDPIETMLANGIPVTDPPAQGRFNLHHIEQCLDPVHIAGDARFAPILHESVGQVMGQPQFETLARGKKGFVAARRAWIEARIASGLHGGLPALTHTIDALEKATSANTFADFPDAHARLAELDVVGAAMRTLRGGILAEFTWPAFESAVTELGGAAAVTVKSLFPTILVYNATRVIALGPDRLADHDFAIPQGGMLQYLLYAGGQFLVGFWDRATSKQRAYWSGKANEPFDVEGDHNAIRWGDGMSIVLPDGGTSFGGPAIRPGDTRIEARANLSTDGTTCWFIEWDLGALKMREFDPKTGRAGRTSWPAFVEKEIARDDGMKVQFVSMGPLPTGIDASPLGAKDGVAGAMTRIAGQFGNGRGEFVTIDGRRRALGATGVSALLRFPEDANDRAVVGGSEWNGQAHVATLTVLDDQGRATATFRRGGAESAGFAAVPPLAAFHFLRTRDAKVSRALRSIESERLKPWIDFARDREIAAVTDTVRKGDATLAGNDAIASAVAAVVHEAAKQRARIEALRESRDPAKAERATDIVGTISSAEFHDVFIAVLGHAYVNAIAIEPEVQSVATYLRGEVAPTNFQSPGIAWHALLGHERFAAARCFAPDMTDKKRDVIFRWLRLVATSFFVEEKGAWRECSVKLEPASEIVKSWQSGRAGLFLDVEKSRFWFRTVHSYVQPQVSDASFVEYSSDGEFRNPKGVTIATERVLDRRGVKNWIESFLARAEKNTNWSRPVDKIAGLAAATGMSNAEAALAWSVLPYGTGKYGRTEPPSTEVREALGLKAQEAKLAMEAFFKLDGHKLAEAYDRACPDDPAALFDPAANDALATRLARAWGEAFGARTALRDDVLALVDKELKPQIAVDSVVRSVVDPGASPLFEIKSKSFAAAFQYRYGRNVDDFSYPTMTVFAHLLPHLYLQLPVGDDYRAKLPALHSRLVACLRDPALVFPLCMRYVDVKDIPANKALFDGISGEVAPIEVANSGKVDGKDNGTFIAALIQQGHSLQVAFRPGRVKDWSDPLLTRLAASGSGYVTGTFDLASFLVSPAMQSMMDRIANTPVAAGRYEADPRLSAPETVKRVQGKYGLDENAATLYLQTLTLAEPTTKSVQTWNAWKPAEYKKAAEGLVAKKLVVEGKRERAGREVFLPGEWLRADSPNLPWEGWKQKHYALPHGALARHVIPRAVHELFAAAWDRVESGDVPKLDEV